MRSYLAQNLALAYAVIISTLTTSDWIIGNYLMYHYLNVYKLSFQFFRQLCSLRQTNKPLGGISSGFLLSEILGSSPSQQKFLGTDRRFESFESCRMQAPKDTR